MGVVGLAGCAGARDSGRTGSETTGFDGWLSGTTAYDGDLFADLTFDRGTVEMHGLSGTDMVEYTLEISGALRTPYEQATDRDALFEEWVAIAEENLEDNRYPIDYLLVSGTV